MFLSTNSYNTINSCIIIESLYVVSFYIYFQYSFFIQFFFALITAFASFKIVNVCGVCIAIASQVYIHNISFRFFSVDRRVFQYLHWKNA